MWILGCVLAMGITWLLMGVVISINYRVKIRKLESNGASQEELAELWRQFARRVFRKHWLFTKVDALWWFCEYRKRFDPRRGQTATAELQRDLLEARPALRKYIK